MASNSPRVLVGRVWHESNGFNPLPTGREACRFVQGEAILRDVATSGSTFGGLVSRLQVRGAEILPSLSLTAPPSGLIEHGFYEEVRDQLVAQAIASRPDAIALDLHGAMGTTATPDAEGDLLQRLRAAVGADVPIAIGLDLHAHVTEAMVDAVDICIACKENPHSDVVECGEKVADSVLAVLDGTLDPVTFMAKVPMILPGAGETASGPLAEIHARARQAAAANPAICDISIFNVFRYADDDDIGQAVVILSDGMFEPARTVAEELAGAFWHERERFQDDLMSIEEALSLAARRSGKPHVLADMGDRVLAGAPGDSTTILRAALEVDGLSGAIPITDPEGARAAIAAGLGSEIDLAVGGRITPGFSPCPVHGRVVHVSSGDFTLAGPFQGGETGSLGDSAVLLVDDRLHLLLTSKPAFSHDPAAFTSQDIAIGGLDFVVVKSGYHFKLNFAGLAVPVLVRTPGVGYYTKGLMQYRKSVFWPEHEIADPLRPARVFDHRRRAGRAATSAWARA